MKNLIIIFFMLSMHVFAEVKPEDLYGNSYKVIIPLNVKEIHKTYDKGKRKRLNVGDIVKILTPEQRKFKEISIFIEFENTTYWISKTLLIKNLESENPALELYSEKEEEGIASKDYVDMPFPRFFNPDTENYDYPTVPEKLAAVIEQTVKSKLFNKPFKLLLPLRADLKTDASEVSMIIPMGESIRITDLDEDFYYLKDNEGTTYHIPKDDFNSIIADRESATLEGILKLIESANKSQGKGTKTTRKVSESCEKYKGKDLTVKNPIKVQLIGNSSKRAQTWTRLTTQFRVTKSHSSTECVLVPIDKRTGKLKVNREFKTKLTDLKGNINGFQEEAIELAQETLSKPSDIEPKAPCPTCEMEKEAKEETPKLIEKELKGFQFETCNSRNNYHEDELNKLVTQDDLDSESESKMCIFSSMITSKDKPKSYVCNGNKRIANKRKACISNKYVTFITKTIEKVTECFPNISSKDILPFINQESHFFHNKGNGIRSLKGEEATGLMQLTNILIKSSGDSFFTDAKLKDSTFCDKLKDNLITKINNKCSTVSLPDGIEKALYMPLQSINWYAFSKRNISDKIYGQKKVKGKLQFNNKGKPIYQSKSTSYMQHWLHKYFGEENFKDGELDKIIYDLSAVLHNRGKGMVVNLLRAFAHDLTKGAKGRKGSTHLGNSKIHQLWKSKTGLGEKMTRESFMNYFTSYIYYEREKHVLNNKKWIKRLRKSISQNEKDIENLTKEEKRLTTESKRTTKIKLKAIRNRLKTIRKKISDKRKKIKDDAKKIKGAFSKLKSKDSEGGAFILSKDCNQMRIETYAKEKFDKKVTCGKYPIPKLRRKKLLDLMGIKDEKKLKHDNFKRFCEKSRLEKIIKAPLSRFY